MKVLVGVDGSSNSFAAVQFAARLLSPNRDELIFLYAVPTASVGHEPLDSTVLVRARTALSQAVFDEAARRLPAAWQSKIERVEMSGPAGAALLDAAAERSVDLVVVGFRGTGFFERFVLGSVSRTVVHSATVPVLVVKGEASDEGVTEEPARAAEGSFQALAAYSGPVSLGERIAAVAGQISWPADAEGTVMTVVQPMSLEELPDWLKPQQRDPDVAAMAEAWRKEHEEMVQAARREVEMFQAMLPECFRTTAPTVVEGRPAEKILAQLHEAPFDLVIVGSRGTGRVARLLVGSTSEQVLSKAPCSVLIAR